MHRRCSCDEQVRGPFRSFRHEHQFESIAGATVMTDQWEHVAPFGPLGRLVDRLVLERHMRGLLEDAEPSAQGRGRSPSRPVGRLRLQVELLAKGAEDLELDPVLRPAGRTLHRHQVVQ